MQTCVYIYMYMQCICIYIYMCIYREIGSNTCTQSSNYQAGQQLFEVTMTICIFRARLVRLQNKLPLEAALFVSFDATQDPADKLRL